MKNITSLLMDAEERTEVCTRPDSTLGGTRSKIITAQTLLKRLRNTTDFCAVGRKGRDRV